MVVGLKSTHDLASTEHVPLVDVVVNAHHSSIRKAEAGYGCHKFDLHDKTLSQKIGDEIFSKRVLLIL